MTWIIDIFLIIILLNTIAAIITVFHRQRSIPATLAWLTVLTLLPIIGFFIFAFLGRGIAQENLFNISHEEHIGLDHLKDMVQQELASQRPHSAKDRKRVV